MDISLDYTQKVSLVRYLDNAILPVKFTIQTDVMPLDGTEDIEIDITFAKIKFWYETIVSRSIVFCRQNLIALDMLMDDQGKSRVSNHLMISPFEPNDDHLASLLQSKMTAFSKGKILFGRIRIENESPSGLVFTFIGDPDDLPAMDDWFNAEHPYYFKEPWWSRDDASTLDLMPNDPDIDFSKRPSWAFPLDFIEKAFRPTKTKKSANDVVIRGAFRPKVIDGGRPPD